MISTLRGRITIRVRGRGWGQGWGWNEHLLDDEVVVAAAEAAVAGDDRDEAGLDRPDLDERRVHVLDAQPLVDAEQHLAGAQGFGLQQGPNRCSNEVSSNTPTAACSCDTFG